MFRIRKIMFFTAILTNAFSLKLECCYIPEYIWNLGIAMACDMTPFPNGLPQNYDSISHSNFLDPSKYYNTNEENKIIWVQRANLSKFYFFVLPLIHHRFTLVVSDGVFSFPSDKYDGFKTKNLINDSRVIAIFAQNVDKTFAHSKIYHLPIGVDFHSIAREKGYFGESYYSVEEQETILSQIRMNASPTKDRLKKVMIDFSHNDFNAYGESRSDILNQLKACPYIDKVPILPRHKLWKIKTKYAFAISPHGYGLDCHRTWEGLLLGNIVIVKTSSLDEMYEGLPVVIVKDWREINEENLDKWLSIYGDAFTDVQVFEKLTHRYWMNKIKRVTSEGLK